MAYVKSWSTKEEVLKDLARASGRRIKNKDLDEGYLVIGDAPPPVIPEDADDEMNILFGEAVSKKAIHTEEDATPDLEGIQQMLRMVKEYNNEDDGVDDAAKSTDCVIAISKVSKLNPNVKEFIPKSVTSPSLSTDSNKHIISPSKSVNNKKNNSNIVEQTVDVPNEDSSKKNTEVSNNIDVDANVNTVVANEYQDIATKLKNKISDAAKSNCYELKKQKNVAIATLLRLYANNSTTPIKSKEPLKLFTPEYFEGKKEDNSDVKIESVTEARKKEDNSDVKIEGVTKAPKKEDNSDVKIEGVTEARKKEDNSDVKVEGVTKAPLNISPSTSTTPEPKDTTTTLRSYSSSSTNSTPVETSPKIKVDPEIKKSIDKVNKWLEEPTKRKSPAVCLGPIAFKRKDPSCKSPVVSDTAVAPKPSGDSQRYKPSKYAEDLGKQYLERSKILESKKKDITWSNLEDVLKEKDLVIKKRVEDQALTSDT